MTDLVQVSDVWKKHVLSLGRNKAGAQAVHTHFLFARLFPVLRQQFTVLTREACNYLGHAYNAIASHFLVTVELLGAQLTLPSVYIDSELVSGHLNVCVCVCVCDAVLSVEKLLQTRLLDSHVFLTLEMDGNLDAYYERRKTVLQVYTDPCSCVSVFVMMVCAAIGAYKVTFEAAEQRASFRRALRRKHGVTLPRTSSEYYMRAVCVVGDSSLVIIPRL